MSKNIRIGAVVLALTLAPIGFAQADEVSGGEIHVPSATAPQASVTAPPPAHVNLQTTSIAAGVGISWGEGTLSFEGERYPFSVKGLSLGEIGAARIEASGGVNSLENAADFAGTYVAVEAGAAAVSGGSTVVMRNSKGVTLTLTAENKGVQLTLAAKGIVIALQ